MNQTGLSKAFLWTAGSWVWEYLIIYYAVLALGLEFNLVFAAGVMSLAMLIGGVSSLPGGLGSAEAVMFTMFLVFGFEQTTALSATLLARFMAYGFMLVISFPFLLRETRKF